MAQRMGIKPGSAQFHRLKKGFVPTYDRWSRPIVLDADLRAAYPGRDRGNGHGKQRNDGHAKSSGRSDKNASSSTSKSSGKSKSSGNSGKGNGSNKSKGNGKKD